MTRSDTMSAPAGCCSRGPAPVVVMYSGGRDSTCLLDVAVRIAGAAAVSALHVNYGLRAGGRRRRAPLRRGCASAWGSSWTSAGPVRPGDGAGNLQAWARDERYRAAGDLAVAPRRRRRRRAHRAPIRWRRSSTGSRRRRAAGRCWACAPRDGALIRPLLAFTREQTGGVLPGAGPALARRRVQRLRRVRPQPHPPRAGAGAGADPSRRPGQPAGAGRDPARRGRGARRARRRGPGGRGRRSRWRRCASSRRRCGASSSSGWPTTAVGGPAAGVARRADEVAAMPSTARRWTFPPAIRATADDGVVRFGRPERERRAREPGGAAATQFNTGRSPYLNST